MADCLVAISALPTRRLDGISQTDMQPSKNPPRPLDTQPSTVMLPPSRALPRPEAPERYEESVIFNGEGENLAASSNTLAIAAGEFDWHWNWRRPDWDASMDTS
jgi:hypothetical protein